ncbi:GerAB/ArcD/ProY family transporter [Virgibacillus ihumii]|uniref:GerAB/ArcD/ProY family transporter n=1 Tax=Virgibacillus ihumii TaxID=2686091 RepID=UPI00157DF686|nr:endospore germination permease [Virgibacillus ihumii]
MDRFEYGDDKITDKEIMIAIPSIVIGVGVLYLPRSLAEGTIGADGWISLLVSGGIITFFTWLTARLAAQFPGQEFLDYASKLVSRPVGICLTLLLTVHGIIITAFEVRAIGDLAKHYLFARTPIEVIMLAFLLVVIYAVSGSRAGVFRLNMMFLPIIIFITMVVILFTLGWFDHGNLLPLFQTDTSGYLSSFNVSIFSCLGFWILLFYMSLVKRPGNAPAKAALGMILVVLIYMILFIACIAVFGNKATANLLYPTVELAKEVEIPGGFFERFESVFFVIWIMAIFNTSALAMDASVFALQSIFKKTAKRKIIIILAPIVFLIGLAPQDITELSVLGSFVGYYGLGITMFTTLLLLAFAKLRGVTKRGEK